MVKFKCILMHTQGPRSWERRLQVERDGLNAKMWSSYICGMQRGVGNDGT